MIPTAISKRRTNVIYTLLSNKLRVGQYFKHLFSRPNGEDSTVVLFLSLLSINKTKNLNEFY